jgi:hypothetical protein
MSLVGVQTKQNVRKLSPIYPMYAIQHWFPQPFTFTHVPSASVWNTDSDATQTNEKRGFKYLCDAPITFKQVRNSKYDFPCIMSSKGRYRLSSTCLVSSNIFTPSIASHTSMRTLPDTQCLHCKGRPRTAHEGSEGLQGYGSTLSLTSVLDGGGWSVQRQGRLASGKETRYLLYRRLDAPQGRSGRVRHICPPPPPTRIFFLYSRVLFFNTLSPYPCVHM